MNKCPYCGTKNIPGDDECSQCGQPLDETLPPPNSSVERSLLEDHVRELVPKTPVTVPPNKAVGEVLRLMTEKRIGCVVVAERDRPLGIFSERDALRKIGSAIDTLATRPVSQFMTPNPQTLVADAKVAFAVQRMDVGGYRHLPIVGDKGELVGIISARDILRHLTDAMSRDE